MSELLENLQIRYLNKMFLQDDYCEKGVLYTNFKKSVVKRWISLFRGSKFCTITYDPPKIINLELEDVEKEVKTALENVNIPEKVKRKLSYFPKYISVPEESLFDINKFIDYLEKREFDFAYLSKDEYEKELPPKRKVLIKSKRKKYGFNTKY